MTSTRTRNKGASSAVGHNPHETALYPMVPSEPGMGTEGTESAPEPRNEVGTNEVPPCQSGQSQPLPKTASDAPSSQGS